MEVKRWGKSKILQLFTPKNLKLKEKCRFCSTKLILNDMMDLTPGGLFSGDDGLVITWLYQCPNCDGIQAVSSPNNYKVRDFMEATLIDDQMYREMVRITTTFPNPFNQFKAIYLNERELINIPKSYINEDEKGFEMLRKKLLENDFFGMDMNTDSETFERIMIACTTQDMAKTLTEPEPKPEPEDYKPAQVFKHIFRVGYVFPEGKGDITFCLECADESVILICNELGSVKETRREPRAYFKFFEREHREDWHGRTYTGFKY